MGPETSHNTNIHPEHSSPQQAHNSQVRANFVANSDNILLRTALDQIKHMGANFTVRTFLSEKIRNRLQLPFKRSLFEVVGIGGKVHSAVKECDLVIFSNKHNIRFKISAIVLPIVIPLS